MAKQKPRTTQIAILPEFYPTAKRKAQVIAEGQTYEQVRDAAQTYLADYHGEYWRTAWRFVYIGSKAEILTKFRVRLTISELNDCINDFRAEKKQERAA